MISKKIVAFFCVLTFLTASSCSKSSPFDPTVGTCEPLSGWKDAKSFRIPDEAQFNAIYLDSHKILLNGTIIKNTELDYYINELKRMKNDSKYVEFYTFLHSDEKYACSEFKNIARKIGSGQKCARDGTCIWGYGLGRNAKPLARIIM
ncbi:MAG TPA: hypothetical protein PKA59_06195 [Chakrabartia sp.]|jgi:hypothetical protein|nr:hypothetical protein [Chakrabartia sp.]